jgi:hypothetical protein
MKFNTYTTCFALFILIVISGCGKDFLNQVPDDRLTLDLVFQNQQYSEEFLANVYSYIRDESDRKDAVPFDGLSDDFDIPYPESVIYIINQGNWTAGSGYHQYWTPYYRGIRSATYFMENIGKNQAIIQQANGAALIKQYTAEARFLRAFFYFNLLRQYGPCVLLGDKLIPTDLTKDNDLMQLPRNSYEECVNYINSELDIAAADLPLYPKQQNVRDYGRATKAMCMAVKSRMLLYAASPQFNGNTDYASLKNKDGKQLISQRYDKEKWKAAADAAKAIIDLNVFSLYKVYDGAGAIDPFLSCRDVLLEPWNTEVILARNSNGLSTYEKLCTPRSINGWPGNSITQSLVDEFEMANGLSRDAQNSGYTETGFSTADGKYTRAGTFNMYVNREPRFYLNVGYSGSIWPYVGEGEKVMEFYYTGSSGKLGARDIPKYGYTTFKNVHPNSNVRLGQYVTRPLILYRYAEVLLSYVEALNEYSPGHADILKYLNMIRERAGLPGVSAGLNQSDMRKKIHHERRIELAVENLRYFDIRRWKISREVNSGAMYGMNMDAGTSLQDPNFFKRTLMGTRAYSSSYDLFPIPQSEIDRDPNLVQNPGW